MSPYSLSQIVIARRNRGVFRRVTPDVKLGKHVRIDSADLKAYINASREEPGHNGGGA